MRLLPALMGALVLTCASTATQAAAGAFQIEPRPGPGQSLSFAEGRGRILSEKATGAVVLALDRDKLGEDEYPQFFLGVSNGGPGAINLTASSISVSTDAGSVRVLTVGDLMLIAKAEVNENVAAARWRAIGAAFGTATLGYWTMDALGATPKGKTGNFVASESSQGGTTTVEGSFSTRDQGAAERAAETLPNRYSLAERNGFRPVTIEPGRNAYSPLPLDALPKKATNLTISVNVNGDTHVFQYALTYSRK
jgi:hypothetical protein